MSPTIITNIDVVESEFGHSIIKIFMLIKIVGDFAIGRYYHNMPECDVDDNKITIMSPISKSCQ